MNQPHVESSQSVRPEERERAGARDLAKRAIGLLQNKTVLVLFDQVVVSGCNFAISVLVSRACGEELFGIYHMGLIFLYYAVGVQNSLVTTPFTIQQAKLDGQDRRKHAGSSFLNQTIIAWMTAIVFLLLFTIKWSWSVGAASSSVEAAEVSALGMMALAAPMFLFKEYARRYCFARFEMLTAILVDCVASLVIVGFVGVSMLTQMLSPAVAYLGMAAGCFVSAVVFWLIRKDRFEIRTSNMWAETLQQWKMGRWVLAEQMLNLSCSFALPGIIYLMMDRLSVGRFTGLCMIVNLANPFLYGMANYLLPKYSEAAESGNRESTKKIYIQYTLFSVVVITGFLAFCLTIGPIFVKKILLVQDFENSSLILGIICLRMVVATGNLTTHPALLALDRAKVSTAASAATLFVLFSGSLLLIPPFGLYGAVLAWLLSTSVEVTWRTGGFFFALNRFFDDKKKVRSEAIG